MTTATCPKNGIKPIIPVFSLNTVAFAAQGSAKDKASVDAYEEEEGDEGLSTETQVQVPENWSINSNPSTWSTATKIVSVNGTYYEGPAREVVDSYNYYARFMYKGQEYGVAFESNDRNLYIYDEEVYDAISNWIEEYLPEEPEEPEEPEMVQILGINKDDIMITAFGQDDPFENKHTEGGSAWTVYSPFSYFFQDTYSHLIDGKLVSYAPQKEDTNYIYRAIPAGTDTFVLVRIGSSGRGTANDLFGVDIGEDFTVLADSVDGKSRVEQKYNTRYNGDEPFITFTGLKNTANPTFTKKGHLVIKKGEDPVFDVDAVLVKTENGKNSVVKGLSVKSVKFKNNVAASFPEDEANARISDYEAGKGGSVYDNGYKITYDKDDKVTAVEFVGPDFKSQLTKEQNANFKGQPSFQVQFAVKGDAKKYSKDVKKASKAKEATFNFEIKQLNIGNCLGDKGSYAKEIPYTYKQEEYEKAEADLKKTFESYVDKYADAILADNVSYPTINTKKKAIDVVSDNMVDCDGVRWYGADDSDEYKNCYVGFINFNNVPLYVDKDVDAGIVKDGGQNIGYTRLTVQDDDAKNLKFSGSNKVSAKLTLDTTIQVERSDTDMETTGGDDVFVRKELVANVKTTNKAGGNADVFLKGLSLTDEVEGEIPFAVAIGQNNLTGAVTMRNYVNNHGDEEVRYGHYKDDENYFVNSVD